MLRKWTLFSVKSFALGALVLGTLLLTAPNSFSAPKKPHPAHPDHPDNSHCQTNHASVTVTNVMWLNHFALLPGDTSVQVSYDSVNSDVGGGLTALVVQSTTTGETTSGGGNKDVHMAVQVP